MLTRLKNGDKYMKESIYDGNISLSDLAKLLDKQRQCPTNILNKMLVKGVTFTELENFLIQGLTAQFSLEKSGWHGLRNHLRFWKKHGREFSYDIDEIIETKDPNKILITLDKISSQKAISENPEFQRKSTSLSDNKLIDLVNIIAERVHLRIDSLDSVYRFKRCGVEAWFKVEVSAALGEIVLSLNNKGPDLTLTDGQQIELKAATDFNPTYFCDGSLKYNVPCLFLGDGGAKQNINRLVAMENIRLVSIKLLHGVNTWAIGCIVPNPKNG